MWLCGREGQWQPQESRDRRFWRVRAARGLPHHHVDVIDSHGDGRQGAAGAQRRQEGGGPYLFQPQHTTTEPSTGLFGPTTARLSPLRE